MSDMMSGVAKIPVIERAKIGALIDAGTYQREYRRSIEQPEQFWAEKAADLLEWETPWKSVRNCSLTTGHIRWFEGGRLNVSVNCLDRHIPLQGDKPAIIWEGNEPGETRTYTYQESLEAVCKISHVLKSRGVKRGDRVAIYMPMIPELAFSMLACARIGAIHTVVFAGFSAESLSDRINDCQCVAVITANEGLRGAKTIPLKQTVDEALLNCLSVTTVMVARRTPTEVSMTAGRDLWLAEAMHDSPADGGAEVMEAEDPLFILYTSGSTGKPKGVLHTTGGYLLHATMTHRDVFDIRPDDIYFCAADCGWVTGHSYIVYGPLSNGATTVMFESIPTYPDAGRYWDVIDRHKVSIFYTAPTAIRAVAKEGDHLVDSYDLSSLRILGSVGEPINEDAWAWYYNRIGKGRCPIVDTWWQTETGGIMITPLPGVTDLKPGSATLPYFGVSPVIVDETGAELKGNGVKGRLCLTQAWPGMMRTVWGDHKRFIDTYLTTFPGKYFTGDACIRDQDGYYWITGRVDDVLNCSGHRLGTAEIESSIVHSQVVAEAAVVGFPHDVKGTGIYAFCILRSADTSENQLAKAADAVRASVRKHIGAFAVPDQIHFVPGLPKTRSGKIMRRILRKMVEGEFGSLGDVSTLADPSVVDVIAKEVRSRLSS